MATTRLLQDLAVRLGVDLDGMGQADMARAEAVLDDAAVAIAAHTGWDITKRESWPPLGRMLLLSVARRVYANPNGYRVEQAGEYSVTRSALAATGEVVLSPGEQQQLNRLAGRTGVTSAPVGR